MPRGEAETSDPHRQTTQGVASRREIWNAYKRASRWAVRLGLPAAFLVAGVLFLSFDLPAWPPWLAWPLAVLAFLLTLVAVFWLAVPDRPAWPPRRPEYDAPPEPRGSLSGLLYELSDRPWRDMRAKRRERRRLAAQRDVRGLWPGHGGAAAPTPGGSDPPPAASGGSTHPRIGLVVAILLVVGAAAAWYAVGETYRQRAREKRRAELERFEKKLPPELRELWEEHKQIGR